LGNHDSEIPALAENIKIHDTDGFMLGDVYMAHGHAWPKKEFLSCKYLIVSHTHPLIEIRDKLGYRFVERVWIEANFDDKKLEKRYKQKTKSPKIILMPAFNWLSGGVAINSSKDSRRLREPFLGPITKLIDKKQTEVFLLDGTYLGALERLKKGI